MFVLMIARRPLALVSDHPPTPARAAGLDRFSYWRGASGRRYLFSVVPTEALADFRSVVAIFAEAGADGRFLGRVLFGIDAAGSAEAKRPEPRPGHHVLVHFMALTDADRRRLIDDLTAAPVRLAA
jgi:hypothetical protein